MAEETIELEKPSLLGMITSPKEQFERIKKRPIFLGALLTVSFLVMLGSWLNINNAGVPMIEGLTEEEVVFFTNVMTVVVGLFTPIFSVLFTSVIYLLIAKIVQSNVTFKQLFSMNTYIMIVAALSLIVNGIFVLVMGGGPENQDALFTSLGSIINADGAIGILLNNIEIFSIWTVVLTAIGLQQVANLTKRMAWTITIAFFIVGIIMAMGGTNLPGA